MQSEGEAQQTALNKTIYQRKWIAEKSQIFDQIYLVHLVARISNTENES